MRRPRPHPTPAQAPPAAGAAPARAAASGGGRDGGGWGAAAAARGWVQLAFILLHLAAVLAVAIYQAVVDLEMLGALRHLPAARPPAPPGGGDASPAPEARVFWILTIISLIAAAAFAAGSVLLWVAGQAAVLRLRRGFRRRGVHLIVWLPTVVVALADFIKLIVLQSVINKLRWQGAWCSLPSEPAEIRQEQAFSSQPVYTFEAARVEAGRGTTDTPPCQTSGLAQQVRLAIITALVSVGLHTLLLFAREPRRVLPKLLGLLPAAVLTALLWIKPVTAMMVWAFAQRYYTDRGNFNLAAEAIVALVALALALGFSLTMGLVLAELGLVGRLVSRPLALCGCGPPAYMDEPSTGGTGGPGRGAAAAAPTHTGDVEGGEPKPPARRRGWPAALGGRGGAAAPRGAPRSLRRGARVAALQVVLLGQLPIVFGLLAPVVLVASLGVWNFWVALDLVVGAALLALLLGLCLLQRCSGGGPDAWVG
ncbi:MAG: hypothetical protein J3K34DRAFT_520767 [Monoraphidium minutum]|nr:MAG: hypothetical protein J3K34DRAFT_520767 [Monoraphidium minutum]